MFEKKNTTCIHIVNLTYSWTKTEENTRPSANWAPSKTCNPNGVWLSACADLQYAALIVYVPFLFGIWGRMRKLIVSVPDHCHFINFEHGKRSSD